MKWGIDWFSSKIERNNTFLNFIEEKLFYPAFKLFSCTLTKQFLALSCMSKTLIIVVDIENDFVPKIDNFILTASFPYILTPFTF